MRRELVDRHRIVRNEQIGRRDLYDRAFGMAPFMLGHEDEQFANHILAHPALIAMHVGDVELSVWALRQAKMKIDRTADQEMPPVELHHRGTEGTDLEEPVSGASWRIGSGVCQMTLALSFANSQPTR
ncbi:MAG: hypothetical protein ACFBQW_07415 [Sphingomonadaceae bacterium]